MKGKIDKDYQAALEQMGEDGSDDLYHHSSIEGTDNTDSYNQNNTNIKPLSKKKQSIK